MISKRRFSFYIISLWLCFLSADTEHPSILKNNIFDASRRPTPVRQTKTKVKPPPAPKPKVSVKKVLLIGTLVTEEEKYAFLQGEGYQPDRPLQVGDSCLDATISEIHSHSISLKHQDQTIQCSIGVTLEQEDDQLIRTVETQTSSSNEKSSGFFNSFFNSSKNKSKSKKTNKSRSSREDILKRLRERRKRGRK